MIRLTLEALANYGRGRLAEAVMSVRAGRRRALCSMVEGHLAANPAELRSAGWARPVHMAVPHSPPTVGRDYFGACLFRVSSFYCGVDPLGFGYGFFYGGGNYSGA